MAQGVKVCRVCGKEYKACSSLLPTVGEYRWQDVACCVEHGAIYLDQVLKARGIVDDDVVDDGVENVEIVDDVVEESVETEDVMFEEDILQEGEDENEDIEFSEEDLDDDILE